MATPVPLDLAAACDAFMAQVVTHHAHGEFYPPAGQVISELGLPGDHAAAVLRALRAYGWIGRGPYGPMQVRNTARGWDYVSPHQCTQSEGARGPSPKGMCAGETPRSDATHHT